MMWRVLDLFCGAGGAAMGLQNAWPDAKITGVDIKPQKNYPFDFVQANALELNMEWMREFDFIWASPPCDAYTLASVIRRKQGYDFPDLIPPTRLMLNGTGKPYVIENVPGSPLGISIRLCGLMFGLPLFRHRYFETQFPCLAPPHIEHVKGACVRGDVFTVTGHTGGARKNPKRANGGRYRLATAAQAQRAMGIDWMTRIEISKAVPPAYSEFIARQFRRPEE